MVILHRQSRPHLGVEKFDAEVLQDPNISGAEYHNPFHPGRRRGVRPDLVHVGISRHNPVNSWAHLCKIDAVKEALHPNSEFKHTHGVRFKRLSEKALRIFNDFVSNELVIKKTSLEGFLKCAFWIYSGIFERSVEVGPSPTFDAKFEGDTA